MQLLPSTCRTDRETWRLQQQARMFEPFTRRLFETASLKEGLKVLDVGRGAGDVAFLATEMVGLRGDVVGLDNKPIVLETARQRAAEAGLRLVY
jgi:ubiquinone/menaquinone biosynthesis C-methylase UbiE